MPGCGHDTDACPAYFPGKGRELCVFTVGETLYVYRPVVTMHYEGSWDDYYAEVVAPKLQERPQGWETLTDEELLAYCRGRYAEQSAPAGLYVIEGGGTSRRALTCTQDLANTTMRWCDGAALYGYAYDALPTGNSAGVPHRAGRRQRDDLPAHAVREDRRRAGRPAADQPPRG